jgi:transcription termination/antitermination protein NusG
MNKPQQPNLPWYGIHVRSKFERVVSATLSGKGYEEFLPLCRTRRAWSDRSKELEVPLFPCYLFCRIDVGDRLLPILTTPGVISIVAAGKVPVSIPDSEIDAIKTVIGSGLQAEPWPQLVVGSKVIIEKGPLAGIEGVTLEMNKRQRLIVSISLLQRSVAVEIEPDWARPLSTAKDSKCLQGGGFPKAAAVASRLPACNVD